MGEQLSDNAGVQATEADVAPDVTPNVDPDASGEAGDGTEESTDGGWSKEGQQIHTKLSQKIAEDRKAVNGKLDDISTAIQQHSKTTIYYLSPSYSTTIMD